MTSRVNGAVTVSPPSESRAPAGWLASVSWTVLGSSRRFAVPLSPLTSRAVSSISRYEGNSWSGAGNDPPATPPNDCSGWVWQEPLTRSQCWRLMSQVRPLGAIGLPAWSVAEPLKAIVSSTFHVVPGAGEVMVMIGTGGEPAVIGTLTVSVRPPGSVTRSRAV